MPGEDAWAGLPHPEPGESRGAKQACMVSAHAYSLLVASTLYCVVAIFSMC